MACKHAILNQNVNTIAIRLNGLNTQNKHYTLKCIGPQTHTQRVPVLPPSPH